MSKVQYKPIKPNQNKRLGEKFEENLSKAYETSTGDKPKTVKYTPIKKNSKPIGEKVSSHLTEIQATSPPTSTKYKPIKHHSQSLSAKSNLCS